MVAIVSFVPAHSTVHGVSKGYAVSDHRHLDLSRWQPSPAAQSLVDVSRPAPELLADLAVEIVEFIGGEFRRETDTSAADLDIATKSSETDPVTRLDTQFEAMISAILADIRPYDTLMGEEGGGDIAPTGITWIADPVDGTVNLVYGLPLSAVSLAVVVDGEFVAGAVHALGLGETYRAAIGAGATMRRVGGAADSPTVWVPLTVNAIDDLALALVATGFSYDAAVRREQGQVVAELLPQVRDIRRLGAAALDLCHVAAGRVDGYYERELKTWDYAAGIVIVREAGGEVLMPDDGQPLVAAPPGLLGDLAARVRT